MSDTVGELRIIAKDNSRLSAQDREAMNRAADELEQAHRALHATNGALFEANQHRVALNDQIKDLKRQGANPPKFPSVSSGWMPLTVRAP